MRARRRGSNARGAEDHAHRGSRHLAPLATRKAPIGLSIPRMWVKSQSRSFVLTSMVFAIRRVLDSVSWRSRATSRLNAS